MLYKWLHNFKTIRIECYTQRFLKIIWAISHSTSDTQNMLVKNLEEYDGHVVLRNTIRY